MQSKHTIAFLPFYLDVQNEQLWKGSQLVPLRLKTFTVLRYLVEHAGQLVTKEELLKGVWSDTRVSKDLPKDYIQELRATLDDDSKSPRFIETVRGRGYRFIAPVATTAQPVSGSRFQVSDQKN